MSFWSDWQAGCNFRHVHGGGSGLAYPLSGSNIICVWPPAAWPLGTPKGRPQYLPKSWGSELQHSSYRDLDVVMFSDDEETDDLLFELL